MEAQVASWAESSRLADWLAGRFGDERVSFWLFVRPRRPHHAVFTGVIVRTRRTYSAVVVARRQ